MDNRTLSTVRRLSETQQKRIKAETEALTAAAEQVRQEDRRRYDSGMQAQQQELHLLGELYGRRG